MSTRRSTVKKRPVTRKQRETAAQRLRRETPVFAAMNGPAELDKIGRGWNITRDRAGRALGESFAAMRDGVAKIDAEWRAQDKVGKELVLYIGN